MKLPLSILVLAGAMAAPLAAQSVTIDFDFYPGPDNMLGTADDIPIVAPTGFASASPLTDEFSVVGVDFTPNPGINDQNEILNSSSFTTPAGHTLPNLFASSGTLPIQGSFNPPVSSVSALIGISGGFDELRIYDAAGALLGSMIGDDVVVTLSSSTPIASFEVITASSTTPAIDNLEFTPIPSGPTLTIVNGQAGGQIDYSFQNFTPGGLIAVLYGNAGSYNVNQGPCNGLLTLDLNPFNFPPASALILLTANGSGGLAVSRNVNAGAAGLILQAVDVPTCSKTPAIVIP